MERNEIGILWLCEMRWHEHGEVSSDVVHSNGKRRERNGVEVLHANTQ